MEITDKLLIQLFIDKRIDLCKIAILERFVCLSFAEAGNADFLYIKALKLLDQLKEKLLLSLNNGYKENIDIEGNFEISEVFTYEVKYSLYFYFEGYIIFWEKNENNKNILMFEFNPDSILYYQKNIEGFYNDRK